MPRLVRNYAEMMEKLSNEMDKNGSKQDPRFYKPRLTKDGTFTAMVRFVPAPGDEVPMVKTFSHSFQGPGGNYNEMCLTTIGQKDPVCDANSVCWNNGDQNTAKSRARKKGGIANVYIINDPQTPECNGKVFLWKFGKQILEKIMPMIKPSKEQIAIGKKPVNIFDYESGANFIINIKTKEANVNGKITKFPNYEDSSFEPVAPLAGGEELYEKIEKQLISLSDFSDPSKFKSYDELKAQFDKVMGYGVQSPIAPAPAQPLDKPASTPAPAQPAQQSFYPVSNQTSHVVSEGQPVSGGQPVAPVQSAMYDANRDAPPFDVEDEIDDNSFFESIKNAKK